MAATRTDSTGDRIIAAATAEFARFGIAGARVERIARTARTSKERVYAYYRSKEELYRFVTGRELVAMAESTKLTAEDLPGYAGRLHDHFVRHPERLRLVQWGRLELPVGGFEEDTAVQESTRHKLELLREAQEAGHLDPAWDPQDVLTFVGQLAMSWAGQTYLAPDDDQNAAFMAARREGIVAAVQRLFPAATANSGARPDQRAAAD